MLEAQKNCIQTIKTLPQFHLVGLHYLLSDDNAVICLVSFFGRMLLGTTCNPLLWSEGVKAGEMYQKNESSEKGYMF
jgi:hypothetical protein